jgi:hypothetical protein
MLLGFGGAKYAEDTPVEAPSTENAPTTEIVPPSTEPTSEPTLATDNVPTSEPTTAPSETTTPNPTPDTTDTPGKEATFDWEEWAKEWLSPQVLTTVTAVLTALVAVLKMVASLKSMAKNKQLTIDGVNEIVVSNLKECVSKEVADKIDAYMPEIIAYEKKSSEIMIAFSKILALAQENTPEARKAILEVIQELGIINNTAVESAKKTIEKQEEAKKAEEAKKTDDLNKIVEETSKPTDNGTTI